MINIQTIQNVADCVPLYLPHSLYLKPLAKMNISVALPVIKTGKSLSNLDIMEKLSAALKPDTFFVLKVSKSTVEFIRFEAELDDRSHLRTAISRLDGTALKISGFSESFRVRASEPKDDFPTRYDWDTFFRDTNHMDEMKAGERPDTIHLTHLPIRWFCPRHSEHEDQVKPSESIFRRIFEKFGSVRCVDIPICDPYRSKMNSDINGMKTFSFEQDVLFEGYVQFDEYVGFVRAMDEFRGMKLVRKFVDKTQAINITVNFDKTKHLSDAQQQRRERVRKRLQLKAKAEEEEQERLKKLEQEKLLDERKKEEQLKLDELEKQREREEKRKEKHLKIIQERGQVEISQKIRIEERKLMIAQRKLESIRILEQLFDRIKLKNLQKQKSSKRSRNFDEPVAAVKGNEMDLRDRLVEKYKTATEKLLNEQKKKVEDIKNKTPLMGLFRKKTMGSESSDDNNDDNSRNLKRPNSSASAEANAAPETGAAFAGADGLPMNPFRAVAALAAAGGASGNTSAYSSETASEWMKSLSMFQYVPPMFPGMPHAAAALYRPPPFPVSVNYRGFAPRMRIRGRGRGRGRGGYDGQYSSSSYYNNYKNYNYDEDNYDEDGGRYRKSSHASRSSRNRSRSRSRSRHYSKRSRSRSHSRRRSRSHSSRRSRSRRRSHSHSTRSRSRSSKRSYTRSRTRSKSKGHRNNSKARDGSAKSHKSPRSRSKTPRSRSKTPQRTNKKLVSTRRSRSASWSSRSRSKSRSKRSWSRSRRSRDRSSGGGDGRVVLETDKLVRSAEAIKQHFEKDMRERMREEEREIKQNFRHCKFNSSGAGGGIVSSSGGAEIDIAMELSEADRAGITIAETSTDNSPTQANKQSTSRRNSYEMSERKVDA